MCGIVGIVKGCCGGFDGEGCDAEFQRRISAGAHSIKHRGPDATGSVTIRRGAGCPLRSDVKLGMTRLAIVDRSAIQVPYGFPYLGVVLAFNGEIYNWKELRAELSTGADAWLTDCDAEVVARAWRRWGPQCLDRFNGMFAFILVDVKTGRVFIARDRAGEKPLYYARHDDCLYLASEIKALGAMGVPLREGPCRDAGVLEFDCGVFTPFKGIYALSPGHYLLLQGQGEEEDFDPKPVQWWELPRKIDCDASYDEILNHLEYLVWDAIDIRCSPDNPETMLLSGGLDSSIIQAVEPHKRCYTLTFPEEGDDFVAEAEKGARGAEIIPVTFDYDEMMAAFPDIIYHLDTPATWTAACQWFLYKKIAEDGGRVVLSGEGADELFAGYSRYRILYWIEQMYQDECLSNYVPTIEYLLGTKGGLLAKLLNRGGDSYLSHAMDLVVRHGSGVESLPLTMARVEFYTTMQVLLRMADRMASAFSLENRSPFLDYRIMELAAKMPLEFKIDADNSKRILRDVALRAGVDKGIVEQKSKKGFYLPWPKWSRRAGSAAGGGSRGAWDRSAFVEIQREAWKKAYFGQRGKNE